MYRERKVEGWQVEFIGGEPLIATDDIITICCGMNQAGVPYSMSMATNGMFSIQPVLDVVEHAQISVCMSLPKDHAVMRPSRRGDSLEISLAHLRELTPGEGHTVSVRYNAHSGNTQEFPSFLEWFNSQEIASVKYIQVQRIDESFVGDPGCDVLSEAEFLEWKYGDALDALLEFGWPLPDRLVGSRGLCRAHAPYSVKVLADGKVVPCAFFATPESDRSEFPGVEDIARDPELVQGMACKDLDPRASRDCQECNQRWFCIGKVACMGGRCPGPSINQSQIFLGKALIERHGELLPLYISGQGVGSEKNSGRGGESS
ncbi:hypothetical protein AAEX63_16115 [Luteococcus sp. H138]|uniref:hypothetical protein n=1 Tax=unclassified Luteococcus TaxID=2639923 RepID=UPI00313B1308